MIKIFFNYNSKIYYNKQIFDIWIQPNKRYTNNLTKLKQVIILNKEVSSLLKSKILSNNKSLISSKQKTIRVLALKQAKNNLIMLNKHLKNNTRWEKMLIKKASIQRCLSTIMTNHMKWEWLVKLQENIIFWWFLLMNLSLRSMERPWE